VDRIERSRNLSREGLVATVIIAAMLLDELKSQRLSSVEFVQDYIQLHFDDYTINLYNPVKVVEGSGTLRPGQVGFRDTLCNLINGTVRDVVYAESDKVELVFENGSSVVVSIADKDSSGPEALMLRSRDPNAPWLVI
jgi:hypothetical protein